VCAGWEAAECGREVVDDEEVLVVDKKVGNLWDLKVCIFFWFVPEAFFSLSFLLCDDRFTGIRMLPLLHDHRNGTWELFILYPFLKSILPRTFGLSISSCFIPFEFPFCISYLRKQYRTFTMLYSEPKFTQSQFAIARAK
jgi:hypothetical protein